MDYLLLGIFFAAAGVLAILYYRSVPTAEVLRGRLPNKVTGAGILITLILAAVVWYVIAHTTGFSRVFAFFVLFFNLLLVETVFLIAMRATTSNSAAVVISFIVVSALAWFELHDLTLGLVNVIVIASSLGAATLLIRLNYLRTKFLFVVSILWTIYDIMSNLILLPHIFVPVEKPQPTLFLPSVTAGRLTLGSGDFMFMVLFTLVILRDHGLKPAIGLVGLETLGLLVTGALKSNPNTAFPFLVVMTPIFLLYYWAMARKPSPPRKVSV